MPGNVGRRDVPAVDLRALDCVPLRHPGLRVVRSPEVYTEEKKAKYTWNHSDNFPPHLAIIPEDIGVPSHKIFSIVRLVQTLLIVSGIQFDEGLAPGPQQNTMGWIKDTFNEPNIGLGTIGNRSVFAQQFFTGPNPRNHPRQRHVDEGIHRGGSVPSKAEVIALFRSAFPDSFYVQDFSNFQRTARGMVVRQSRCSTSHQTPSSPTTRAAWPPLFSTNASIPLTVWTKRTTGHGAMPKRVSFPQTALHEIIIHLNNTHLVEEAVIVVCSVRSPIRHRFSASGTHPVPQPLAAVSSFPTSLSPSPGSAPPYLPVCWACVHQLRLESLVRPNGPEGISPHRLDDNNSTTTRTRRILRHVDDIEEVCVILTAPWLRMRISRIGAMKCDREGAGMKNFPKSISTPDDLIDMVTMCIYITASQHCR
ncbi:lipoxygenase [Salix suchowensis]|nr:lipoxygenase [Salix suchowensis]